MPLREPSQLDEAEREHLFDLAQAAASSPRRPARKKVLQLRPSIRRILDGMTGVPAYVRDAHLNILDANVLCRSLYGDTLAPESLPLNLARFVFIDQQSKELFIEWETIADDVAGILRAEAGRTPEDRNLSDLIGELATRSDPFRKRWARHNVRLHRTALKKLRNPLVGEIELTGDALELTGDGLTLITYTAPKGSEAQQQLDLLLSWLTSDRVEKQ